MKDRFLGSLFGLVIGDGLGSRFEGSPPLYGINEKDILNVDKIGYTDDTVMALCLARSIINKKCFEPEDVAEEYLKAYLNGEIIGIGYTTRRALERYRRYRNWETSGIVDYWAAGNGVAMRIAPLALYCWNESEDILYENVRKDAYITHRNELAISGAFTIALMIKYLINGLDKFSAFEKTVKTLKNFGIINKLTEKLEHTYELYQSKTPSNEAYRKIGTSGFVIETVSSAIFTLLQFDHFTEGLVQIIKAGGDTDTNAAIYGAMMGALVGIEGIPSELKEKHVKKNEVIKIAEKIYELAAMKK